MTSYKTCIVPMCTSTTVKNPEKLFIHVPVCPKRRCEWLQLAHRDPKCTSGKYTMYFCEDHFDLPVDMENYIQYSIMGCVGKIRMKPDCLPSKFVCQPDRLERTASPKPIAAVNKRQSMEIIQEIPSKETDLPSLSGMTGNSDFESFTEEDQCLPVYLNKATQVHPEATDEITQVFLRPKFRSKAVQTIWQSKHKCTSPIKPSVSSAATSPFKITIESFGNRKIKRKLFTNEKLDIYSSNSSSPFKESKTDTSPSIKSSLLTSYSSDPETQFELEELKKESETKHLMRMSLENTIRLIKNNPRYYIGVPKNCYFQIDILREYTELPEEHILLCLKKIRLNTSFFELGDQFGMSLSYASKIFARSVPLIAKFMRPFIIKSSRRAVKRNLPIAFRHKYHDIYCIIDCLEIEIQKPTKSVEQALSWSEYKKANTAKYLISSTPDGIINYISPGFSGRITDVLLVKNCDFVDCLEPGVSILADRGFKHIDEILLQKGINLVRPPSVSSNSKLSKQDVMKTKRIASLRIHIERVIRRLREFSMLRPHSVVNKNLLKYLDDCVVIACALINLQDSIIKNT